MRKKDAILIDIDGTCCDSRYPVSYLNGERDKDNYKVYYRTLDVVKPIFEVILDIHNKVTEFRESNPEKDITLVFLTGRTADIHAVDSTLRFIDEFFIKPLEGLKVHYDFYFRPINLHVPSIDYKLDKFIMLQTLYNFNNIYEDELSNIEMFNSHKQEGCVVHWIKNGYDYSLEEQITTNPSEDVIVHTL